MQTWAAIQFVCPCAVSLIASDSEMAFGSMLCKIGSGLFFFLKKAHNWKINFKIIRLPYQVV